MKIYVAAKFEKKELVHDVFRKLRALGHEITYDWTTHKNIKPYNANQETASIYSQNEVKGIRKCDVLIYIADERGTTLPMEFGFALALAITTGKPHIFAVGEYNTRSPWFFNPVVRRTDSVNKVLNLLEDLEGNGN
ncbi:nucleoside 2-deoxyribosyltransferase [Candidatus Woesearchaeota archaeon]|nr:nucleoside 2-deoxyribosyltransferase [Candidatus Woesearchaeota archaeon]